MAQMQILSQVAHDIATMSHDDMHVVTMSFFFGGNPAKNLSGGKTTNPVSSTRAKRVLGFLTKSPKSIQKYTCRGERAWLNTGLPDISGANRNCFESSHCFSSSNLLFYLERQSVVTYCFKKRRLGLKRG